jgi:hypothetical protein
VDLSSPQVWQLLTLTIRSIHVVVQVEEVARHPAKNAAAAGTFLRLFTGKKRPDRQVSPTVEPLLRTHAEEAA